MAETSLKDLLNRVREFLRLHTDRVATPTRAWSVTFERLAFDVFAAQFAAVAPYQALCRARGITPATLGDWRDIPAVPTSAFKAFEFTSLAPNERSRCFHSSGTTGASPSQHFHSADSLALYEESVRAWFQPHLLPEPSPHPSPIRWERVPEGRVREASSLLRQSATNTALSPVRWRFLVLAPPASEAPHSSLAHMFTHVAQSWAGTARDYLARGDAGGRWHLDTERALAVLRDAVRGHRPTVVLGTAFMFVHLLDALGVEGRKAKAQPLPPGSRVLETGGYKGQSRAISRAELYAAISQHLGVPASHIISEYGMSELSSQAYDQAIVVPPAPAPPGAVAAVTPTRSFRFPPWARAWVVSPENGREVNDGEVGLLRVLDLANVRSVMAVQTEDLAIRRGDGFELVGRRPRSEAKGCSLLAA